MNQGYSIYHNLLIKGSAKEVFDAISLPKHLNNWWPLKSSGEPIIAATYNLNFTDEYDWWVKLPNAKSTSLSLSK